MKKTIVLFTLFSSLLTIHAQNQPIIQWQQNFGGSSNDYGRIIKQTSEGGYVFGGYSFSGATGNKTNAGFGGSDFWIVKLDANGGKQWERSFGGTNDEYLYDLQQTGDSGYILGGASNSDVSGNKTAANFGSFDFWVVKLDSNGDKQWERSFGGTSDDYLFSLQQTADNGYILGGYSASGASGNKTNASLGGRDYWIVKLDSDGNKQWEQSFGGTLLDELRSLQQTSDGGYILGGFSYSGISSNKTSGSNGESDYWIVKLDADGNKQWDNSFGGNSFDELRSLRQTSDGGYILGGYSFSGATGNKSSDSLGSYDFWVVKVNADGAKQWERSHGGTSADYLHSVQQTSDDGYLLGGFSYSGVSGNKTSANVGQEDCWVIKLDMNGNKQWEQSFGGNLYDEILSLQETGDGGYIFGGLSDSGISGNKTTASFGLQDFWVVKMIPPPLLHFNSFSISSDNIFHAQLTCLPETNYIFQASTNLTDWISLFTNSSAIGLLDFSSSSPGSVPFRFFRAQQHP